MPRFRFRLETVLKLRRAQRDERRQRLAEAHEAQRVLREHQQELAAEIEQVRSRLLAGSQPGAVNVDALLDVHRYELMLRARRGQLEQQQARVAAEAQRRRQALVEADREVRMLEKLEEKQALAHRRREERLELKQLDEAAQLPLAQRGGDEP
jgi:flagellar FliJ protein